MADRWFGIWDTKTDEWFLTDSMAVVYGPDVAMAAQYRTLRERYVKAKVGKPDAVRAEFNDRFLIAEMNEFGQPRELEPPKEAKRRKKAA